MPQPTQVTRQLRALAEESRLSDVAEQLRGLALAVEGVDRDPWLDVALHQAFDPRRVVQAGAAPGGRRLFHIFPAVAVFLPIVVTWYGLYRATGAFREAVAADPAVARRSFLELWNTGMVGHLPAVWRFERVALYDVVAVLTLCLVIGVEAVGRSNAEACEESATAAVVGRLSAALVDADLLLAPHRLAAPARFGAELAHAAGSLRDLVQQAVSAAEHLGEAARQVGSLSDRLHAMDDYAVRLNSTAQSQAAAVSAVLGSAGRTLEGSLDRAMSSVRQSLLQLQDQAQRTSRGQDQVLAALSGITRRAEPGRAAGAPVPGAPRAAAPSAPRVTTSPASRPAAPAASGAAPPPRIGSPPAFRTTAPPAARTGGTIDVTRAADAGALPPWPSRRHRADPPPAAEGPAGRA